MKNAAGVTCAHAFIRRVFRCSIPAEAIRIEANDTTGTRMRLGTSGTRAKAFFAPQDPDQEKD